MNCIAWALRDTQENKKQGGPNPKDNFDLAKEVKKVFTNRAAFISISEVLKPFHREGVNDRQRKTNRSKELGGIRVQGASPADIGAPSQE